MCEHRTDRKSDTERVQSCEYAKECVSIGVTKTLRKHVSDQNNDLDSEAYLLSLTKRITVRGRVFEE